MTPRERWTEYLLHLTPQTPFCVNCRWFYRHYTASGTPLDWGHCVHPRVKARRVYDTCQYFENTISSLLDGGGAGM